MAILIQPRDLRAMVRGWTPGMTPRNNSLPRQKIFLHYTIPKKYIQPKGLTCNFEITPFEDIFSFQVNFSHEYDQNGTQLLLSFYLQCLITSQCYVVLGSENV